MALECPDPADETGILRKRLGWVPFFLGCWPNETRCVKWGKSRKFGRRSRKKMMKSWSFPTLDAFGFWVENPAFFCKIYILPGEKCI